MLKGNIYKELIRPATHGVKSNDRKGNVRIPLRFMDKSIKEIADVTRSNNPFEDKRRGNVILRKRMAVV